MLPQTSGWLRKIGVGAMLAVGMVAGTAALYIGTLVVGALFIGSAFAFPERFIDDRVTRTIMRRTGSTQFASERANPAGSDCISAPAP